MPTLNLSRRVALEPDGPLDGPGCHVVCEARGRVSRGWVARLLDGGGRRLLEPAREVYHAGDDVRLRVYTDLPSGTFEAHSVLDGRRAHRTVFAIEAGPAFRLISPAPGRPEQLALWDPCKVGDEIGASPC